MAELAIEGEALHRIATGAIRAERIFAFEDAEDLLLQARHYHPNSAHDMQVRLLPTRPPHVPGFEINALSVPAAEVGGDHFNFFAVGGDRLGILIADVSGKGMPAALLATMLRATFRTQSWGNRDVRDVLKRANSFLSRVLPVGNFITCTYGILDLVHRSFTFSRAGHEPLVLGHASGEVEVLAPAGLPLGIAPDREFRELLEVQSLQLNSGDRVVLFSDGLTECMNAERVEFGLERIVATLQSEPGDGLEALRRAAENFADGEPAHDDLTLLTIAVT